MFLEDLGIEAPIVVLLLSRVSREGSAELPVSVPAELLEVLCATPGRSANRAGKSEEASPLRFGAGAGRDGTK